MIKVSKKNFHAFRKCTDLNFGNKQVFRPVTISGEDGSTIEHGAEDFPTLGHATHYTDNEYKGGEGKGRRIVRTTFIAVWRVGFTTFMCEKIQWNRDRVKVESYIPDPKKAGEMKLGCIDLDTENVSWWTGPITCIEASEIIVKWTYITPATYAENSKSLLLKMTSIGSAKDFIPRADDAIKF